MMIQQIVSLLQAMNILLAMIAGGNVTSTQMQAIQTFSAQAAVLSQQAMVQLQASTTMEPTTTTPDTQPAQTSPSTTPSPTVAPTTSDAVTSAPVSQAKIVIINQSDRNSRIQDPHVATLTGNPTSNDNILDIGAVVYDDNGNVITGNTYDAQGNMTHQGLITITTSDPNQNTTTFSRNVNGQIYFPFEYVFKWAGDHTITFSINGLSQSVTVTAK